MTIVSCSMRIRGTEKDLTAVFADVLIDATGIVEVVRGRVRYFCGMSRALRIKRAKLQAAANEGECSCTKIVAAITRSSL